MSCLIKLFVYYLLVLSRFRISYFGTELETVIIVSLASAEAYWHLNPVFSHLFRSQKSLKGGLHISSILRGSRSYKKARKKLEELLDDDDTIVPDSQPTDGLRGWTCVNLLQLSTWYGASFMRAPKQVCFAIVVA